MSNTKALILAAAAVAALSTIFLQHRQNTNLVKEIAATHEENSHLQSQASATPASANEEGAQQRIQELDSEVTRLRGAASRAARAEAEVAQLRTELQAQRGRQSSGTAGLTSANSDVLAGYIGGAVEPPTNLDPAYSKDGLVGAIQTAAQKAGITLKRVGVDDSEFPFLLGVASEPGDWEKLKSQLKSMNSYAYFGSVGDDNKNVFSITPHQAYPPGTDQTINRRMTLRMQIFYDKFTVPQN
jgi:hypothetical protein